MQIDEKEIVDYLKGWSKSFVSGKEIARKVGGRDRYEKDRGWAIPILAKMVRRGVLETDHLGYFRLRQDDEEELRSRRYLSPQILRLLKNSGRAFKSFTIDEDDDDNLPKIQPVKAPEMPEDSSIQIDSPEETPEDPPKE